VSAAQATEALFWLAITLGCILVLLVGFWNPK
jgi:hypothetical protein